MTRSTTTREYKHHLQGVLEAARLRLSERDFKMMSTGILIEIERIEEEISRERIAAFVGCNDVEPVFPHVIRFCSVVKTRLIDESRSIVTPQIGRANSIQSLITEVLPANLPRERTMVMNPVCAI